MATKVYGIPGRTTVEINIPVGKAILPITFERGCLDRKNYKPATFSTNKKYLQDMIEGSTLFGKTIKLVKVYGKDEPEQEKPVQRVEQRPATKKASSKVKPATQAFSVYENVTTLDEAREVLKSLGAKATQLIDADAIKKTEASFGLSFPNCKYE